MPTAHCVSTTNGVILAVDRGFLDLVQRPEDQVIGASYRDLTHPDDLEKSAIMLSMLVDRAPPFRLQKRYMRPDGRAVAASLFVTYFNNPGRLVGTLFWHDPGNEFRPERLWEAALRIQHIANIRREAFGDRLITDPVGTLLVAIYLAEAEGRVVGVETLASETRMAPSTTRRWITALQQEGIIWDDSNVAADVQFTQSGLTRMEGMLASVFQAPTLLPDMD